MSAYKMLRTWAMVLLVLGVLSVISAGIGVVSLAIAVEGFWDTMGVIFFGTPIALLLRELAVRASERRSGLWPRSVTVSPSRSTPTEVMQFQARCRGATAPSPI